MKFKALCNRLEEENFISCLLVILEYACSLMLSHYQMSKWHDEHDKYVPSVSSICAGDGTPEPAVAAARD